MDASTKMNKLNEMQIHELASKFYLANTDEPRQTIVDQLGLHPVNHAMFAYELSQHHPHYMRVYLDLTKNM